MAETEHDPYFEDFKNHIEWEDSMDDSMFDSYLKMARSYVRTATDGESKNLVLMVASILNDFRVPEKSLGEAMDSLTPFFISEVLSDETSNE